MSANKMKHGAFGLVIFASVGVTIDPFFFYIPFLSRTKMCFGTNTNLWNLAFALRSFADVPYFLIFVCALSKLRRSKTVKSIFHICLYCLVVIPFPQYIFYGGKMILKTLSGYTFWDLILFIQCVTRLTLIFPLCEQLKTRLSVTKRIWVNPLANLVFYINLAHVIGASWCYLSLKRLLSCWHHVCKIVDECVDSFFECGDGTNKSTFNTTLVKKFCTWGDARQSQILDFGIYGDALQSQIFERTRFLNRILRSFSWGLRNLMSSASNLQTSTDEGETFFVMMIAVVTLTLIVCLPNFQRYAELESERSERIADKMKLIKPRLKLLVKYHNLNECTENLIMDHIQNALGNDINSFNLGRLHINRFLNDDTNTESLFEDFRILETSMLNPRNLNIQGKAEKWLSDNNISPNRNNILFYLICGLKDDQDVNLESVLSVLPDESKWIIKKHLCFDTSKKMPGLQNIDEEGFRRMSSILEPKIFSIGEHLFGEGEPLDFIMFITGGVAWRYKTSCDSLEKGDFYGQELLQWKLDRLELDNIPLSSIPFSTANVKCHTQVEALVLRTKDLASCSDFPVDSRSVDSATEGVDSSNRTEEGTSEQREIQRYAELASARSERIVDKMKLIKPKIELLVKSHNLSKFTENFIMEHIHKLLENDNRSFNFKRLHVNRFLNADANTESLFKNAGFGFPGNYRILNPKKLNIQEKAEKWLSDNNFPPHRNNILFYLTCGLKDDQDVNLRSVLSVLPYKPQWMTKKDLVPGLQNIDEEWFRRISSKLKPVTYPMRSYIFREGEPLDLIIFITYGIAWIYKTSSNAGGINSFQKGDFFGVKLLDWKLERYKEIRELESDRIPCLVSPFKLRIKKLRSNTKICSDSKLSFVIEPS